MTSRPRLQKEHMVLRRDQQLRNDLGIFLLNDSDSLTNFKASIRGPPDTPYAGGTFVVKVTLLSDYPYKPPLVQFVTKIWHPNVGRDTGFICLDILDDKWRAGMTLRTALISVQQLLASPCPESAQDIEAGNMMIQHPQLFNETAVMWTHIYAQGPTEVPALNEKIQQLEDMQLGKNTSQRLLQLTLSNWDVSAAAENLIDEDQFISLH